MATSRSDGTALRNPADPQDGTTYDRGANFPGNDERMPLIPRPQPPSIPSADPRASSGASALSNVAQLASSLIPAHSTAAAPISSLTSAIKPAAVSATLSSVAQTASSVLHTAAQQPSGAAPGPSPAPAPSPAVAALTSVAISAANAYTSAPASSSSSAPSPIAAAAAAAVPQALGLASNAMANVAASHAASSSSSAAAVSSVASVASALLSPNAPPSYGTLSVAPYPPAGPYPPGPASLYSPPIDLVPAFHPDSANSYATTKTFAKGFLDLSLLTSNLSLLRVYAYNHDAQARLMMLILVSVSIAINLASALMSLILFFQKPDEDDLDSAPKSGVKWRQYGKHTRRINTALAVLALASVAINAVITAFTDVKS